MTNSSLICKFVVFSGKKFLGIAVDLLLSRPYSNLSERSTFFQPVCYFEFRSRAAQALAPRVGIYLLFGICDLYFLSEPEAGLSGLGYL